MKKELQSFEEEFFLNIREKEAWKNISGNEDLPWDINLIEKNVDKLNWEELSGNESIIWDTALIEKFKYKIDWDVLSATILGGGSMYRSRGVIDMEWTILKKFDTYWNWHELSKNSRRIPVEILEQYADNWDWKELIDNNEISWTLDLFNKFKRYIPTSCFETLQNSSLWQKLIKIDEQILTGKLLSE